MTNREFKKGGVSIFIVIMVSILVSIMSASFFADYAPRPRAGQ